PHERGVPLRAAELQRLEDERGNLQVTRSAAVGDLLHLHEAVARGAPRLVGLGLLREHAIEIRLALRRLLRRPGAQRNRTERGESSERSGANGGIHASRSYTDPAAFEARACARESQSQSRCAASIGVAP